MADQSDTGGHAVGSDHAVRNPKMICWTPNIQLQSSLGLDLLHKMEIIEFISTAG